MQNRGIKIILVNNDGYLKESTIYFNDRNPARRGLDFDELPTQKVDFLRYAVQYNCINPIRDIPTSPLPPLEEIAHGMYIQLQDVIQKGTQSRRHLDAAITSADAEAEWYPDNPYECIQSLELNKHLRAEGAMTPRRVQDPEGAKMKTISFHATAGAVAAVVKRRFLLTCYTEEETGRLRLDAALTTGDTVGAMKGAPKNDIRQQHAPPQEPKPK